ncbi:MAG TPA: alpha/beta hydrolase [Candidatus Binatia bacterium]|nr:alpha/beta hydrolase [Candidatus Binatia bacterium]
MLAGLLIIVMLQWFEHSQVYRPDRFLTATGAELGRPFEDVFFSASDGMELNGWFYPANTNSPRGSWVVLVCHGNAGNIGHRLDLCQTLLATAVNVFLFDYRGFGRSQGRPSEEGTYLDAQAAHHWLAKKGFAARNILVFGESLGGGIASELAEREETGGLILQSTFTSVPDLGAELFPWLPVRWLGRIQYDTRRKLPRLHVPVLVMHSRTDGLISFHHAERNFASANEPKLFCELKGTHNDPLSDQASFNSGIEKFLQMLSAAKDDQTNRRDAMNAERKAAT